MIFPFFAVQGPCPKVDRKSTWKTLGVLPCPADVLVGLAMAIVAGISTVEIPPDALRYSPFCNSGSLAGRKDMHLRSGGITSRPGAARQR